jgi:hypothetical protein
MLYAGDGAVRTFPFVNAHLYKTASTAKSYSISSSQHW